jgi:hypothetical protein
MQHCAARAAPPLTRALRPQSDCAPLLERAALAPAAEAAGAAGAPAAAAHAPGADAAAAGAGEPQERPRKEKKEKDPERRREKKERKVHSPSSFSPSRAHAARRRKTMDRITKLDNRIYDLDQETQIGNSFKRIEFHQSLAQIKSR